MKLLDSLLDAIVRLEGDALVMHVGEKPYVVTASSSMNAYRGPLAWGQVELSSRVLTFDAVSTMLGQILPADQQQALTEFGAIEHEIPAPVGIADRFTVVAARGGEDVWVELRRKPVEAPVASATATGTIAEPAAAAVHAVESQATASVEPQATVASAAVIEEPAAVPIPIVPAADPPPVEAAVDVEIPGIEIVQESGDGDEPAAHVEFEPTSSIVVAIPGQDAEEIALNAVPDNAIQIVDDEPQGVPTEEEVDAMLAATAGVILTSGLGEVVDEASADARAPQGTPDATGEEIALDDAMSEIAPVAIAPAFPVVEHAPVADAMPDAQPLAQELAVEEQVPIAAPSEPPFELSPPPLETAVVAPELEVVPEPPAGTPLFSPEAELAATAGVMARSDDDQPAVGSESNEGQTAVVAEGSQEPIAEFAPTPEAWSPEVEPAQMPASEQPAEVEAPVLAEAPAAPIEHPEPPAFAEVPLQVEPPTWYEPPAYVETAPAIDQPAMPPSAMTYQPEDVITIIQSAEPAASEPMPPMEVLSVPETTMEVTPELQHQEAPMAHMSHVAGEAAVSTETPSHPAHDHHGVVVPLARTGAKPEAIAAPFTPSEDAALIQTLRVAAARGASTVYVVAQSKPMIRIDGEIGPLESEPTLTAADVDRLVLELAPPRRRDALQNGPVEWLCDVPGVGRVRCLTFRDHRGPGVLFRMMPPRAISVDQLGLTPEVQALCQQSDGLVLVAGGRSSGKSTLLNSFVDVINRTRSDHLITVESQIGFVHESKRSFVSQRETRGDADLAATCVRAALREDPDVIVVEDLRSADLVAAAIEAAESGRLVLASIGAASTIGALERLIEFLPADRRARARSTLATSLRGVIAQVLLRRNTGGRIAAREILLNTPAVSQIVLEGKMFQLPVALDSGRRHGMIPLTDSLAAHVRAGTVDVAEAYRKALDRAALVALLKREGVDTSFAERLA